jgi:DNA-binding beta-propeller fold protein YncE
LTLSFRSKAVCGVAALLCCYLAPTSHAQSAPLTFKQTIPLPGVEGRIDHFAADASGQRLFVCALGNNSVEVIDLRKGERVRSITGLGAPQGVGYVPQVNRLFVANDKGGICKIYDAKSFQPAGELNLQDDADNIRYDDAEKKIYVGFGSGGIAVVNAADGKEIGSIKLPAHPEAFALEANGKRIFVNVPNARQVAVIDRSKGAVIAKWKTDLATANFPMSLDESNHRLFIGCRLPSKLIVLNTDSGEIVANVDLSGDADDLFYDARRRRIYAICGAGKIDAIEQVDPNTYKLLTKVNTAIGARTGLFVPDQNKLFVAVPHHGSQEAEIRVYEPQ